MAHSNNILHTVTLPDGSSYEIHDAHAVHTLADLATLGMNIEGIFVFKDTVATVTDLPTSGNKIGDVYHVTANHSEYVWAKVDNGESEGWEEFGEHFVIDHIHDVTVTGANTASTVTGKVAVPVISPSTKYMTATATAGSVTKPTDSVLGANTTFSVSGGEASTTKIKANATGTAVGATGTADAITGFGDHSTAPAIIDLDTTTPTKVTIPNVTNVGSASSWSFEVNANGVLVISGSNSTVPTLGAALTASKLGTDGTTAVVTGSKNTANAIVALGTPTTEPVLTGVTVTSEPTVTLSSGTTGDISVATGVSTISVSATSNDLVDAVTNVSVGAPTVTLLNNGTSTNGVAFVDSVSVDSTDADLKDGSAAAQVWNQNAGYTDVPKPKTNN